MNKQADTESLLILSILSIFESRCPKFVADNGRGKLAPAKSGKRFFERFFENYSASGLHLNTSMSARVSRQSSEFDSGLLSAAQSLRAQRLGGDMAAVLELTAEPQSTQSWRRNFLESFVSGIQRRWRRERRRRKVGRAYDMALEIARVLPRGSEVLDVGCGNGFIAHHLSAMLGTQVLGIDVEPATDAPIDYRRYDGAHFPAQENSFDAVLFCYVLHHAQDTAAIMKEMRRVLRDGGLAIVYEDIPVGWWDKFVCWTHNRQWRNRTGPCTFRLEFEWRYLFEAASFEVLRERQLSRLRNLTHPVARRFYLLRTRPALPEANASNHPRTTSCTPRGVLAARC